MNSWHDFYQNIRDPSWPECVNEHEFVHLPHHIQQEILKLHNGKSYLELTQDDIVDVFVNDAHPQSDSFDLEIAVANDFKVYYNYSLDGGGNSHGQQYPLILKYLYPDRVFNHCLDWCGGHGVIGFRLLADGVCKNLHFIEMHGPAIDACKKTIEKMPDRFIGKVSLTHASTLASLPEKIKFDLVVSNPPHFPLILGNQLFKTDKNSYSRITVDRQWQCHKDFFAHIAGHLEPDGVILLQEIYHVDEFKPMIDESGLVITKMFAKKHHPLPWYLELKLK
jgi:16S rRNA G966 N2-methylase RsmD